GENKQTNTPELKRGNAKGEQHTILYTPIPKFWLNGNCQCITFKINFGETMYYHLVLLGKCVWDIPEEIILEVSEDHP
ncbi:MAG: hypothetical protein ACPL3B_09080, partial [Fervidobacterium sp.]